MKLLLTGGSGFVGSALLPALLSAGHDVVCALRKRPSVVPAQAQLFLYPGLDLPTDWREALQQVDVVVHSAALAHVLPGDQRNALHRFRQVNVAGTLQLARQAATAGVKRFIFISSVKAVGEGRSQRRPYHADELPQPVDPYGISKAEAERGLQQIADETGMELVVIRPVLVYGPGVGANFQRMIKWLDRGVPLPFAAIRNKRSFLAIDNLVDFVLLCVAHPAAANQVFLLSDGEDLSTSELLRRLAQAMGKKGMLIAIPGRWVKYAAWLLGQSYAYHRLWGSLTVDISKTRELLGWQPPYKPADVIDKTVRDYRERIQ